MHTELHKTTIADFAYQQMIDLMSEKPIPALHRARLHFAEQDRFDKLMGTLFVGQVGQVIIPVQWGEERCELVFGVGCDGQGVVHSSIAGGWRRTPFQQARGVAVLLLDDISVELPPDSTLAALMQRIRQLHGLPEPIPVVARAGKRGRKRAVASPEEERKIVEEWLACQEYRTQDAFSAEKGFSRDVLRKLTRKWEPIISSELQVNKE